MANKLLIAILLLTSLNGFAQPDYSQSQISISGPYDIYSAQTDAPGIDQLFVIEGSSVNGAILDIKTEKTEDQDENQDEDLNYTFEWKRFDPDSKEWSILVATGNRSSYPLSIPGGYQLIISKGEDTIKTARCWIFTHQLDDFHIEVENNNCDLLSLLAMPKQTAFSYFDELGDEQELPFQYRWTFADQTTSNDNNAFTIDAPLEDLSFQVELLLPEKTSKTQVLETAIYDHTAIAVKASYSYESTKPTVEHEGHSEAEGSAPFELRFTDESEGPVSSWEWDFGSRTSVTRDPFHVFTAVGQDTVTLRVQSAHGCESIDNHLVVTITNLLLEAPNAFTPNNDGVNDEFRVYYRSVRKFSMVIFNSWGRKVYESTDPSLGWDGTIGNQVAEPGVYFYVIEAEGYDFNEKKKLQGPLHLIRGK